MTAFIKFRGVTELWLLMAALVANAGCSPNKTTPPTTSLGATGGVVGPTTPAGTAGTPAAVGAAAAPMTSGTPATGSMTLPVAQAGTGAVAPLGGTTGSAVAGSGAPTVPVGPDVTPSGASEWTMIGHDAGSTYYNASETKLTKDNAASLAMAWQVDMGTAVYGAPLMVGDTIYGSAGTGIRAFEAESGKESWRTTGGTTGSMAFDAGTLYYYTASGNIVALNAADGKMKWSKAPKGNPGGDGSSSPIIAGNFVLIGGSSGGGEVLGARFRGFLAAFDKTSGEGMWTTFTVPASAAGASLWSSPAADVAGGKAFGATGNNHGAPATDSSDALIGFDLMSGELLWKNQRVMGDTWGTGSPAPDADFGANPVLYETLIGGVMTKVVSSGNKSGEAHAVKRDDGMLIWTRQLCPGSRDGSLGIFVNATWSGKYMMFACNKAGASTLFGLDAATGEIAYMTPLPGEVYGRMSATPGVGYVGAGRNLVVFDSDTGKILKMVPSKGGTVAGTIAVANGRVAFGEGLTWATGVSGRTLTVLKVP